jgi:hypothetical protein
MWLSLKSPEVVQAYLREASPEPPLARQVLARLLGDLQRREDLPDRVYAVTSLGRLRLTTAPDGLQEDRHAFIFVGLARQGSRFFASYFPAGCRHSRWGRDCREEELPHLVECLLLRLLLES